MNQYPIKIVGSVKNIREVRPFSEGKMGEAIFEFTDDSSVKDYGKLPFSTPYKGSDLCAMAAQCFIDLEKMGIPTIFKEQVSENTLLVDYVRVLDPEKIDLTSIRKNRLIPLEFIIRNIVTATSSARKRLERGTLHPHALGLTGMPSSYPCLLPKMYLDGSTKLGVTDEYLPWDELKELAKESVAHLNQIELMTKQIGLYALEKGRQAGLVINDFKLEWALDDQGEIILADVPLTLDEITTAYVGRPYDSLEEVFAKDFQIFIPGKVHDVNAYLNISKQIYRDHYSAAEPEWVDALERAKQDRSPYPTPQAPPNQLVEYTSQLFGGIRNLWCNQKRDVPPLEQTSREFKTWASEFYSLGVVV